MKKELKNKMSKYLIIYYNKRDINKWQDEYLFLNTTPNDKIIEQEMLEYKLDNIIINDDDVSTPILNIPYNIDIDLYLESIGEYVKNKDVILLILDYNNRNKEIKLKDLITNSTVYTLFDPKFAIHIFNLILEIKQLQKIKSINIINIFNK
ncbi:hypothetical protein [Alphaentomopoxvirus acuprea]|uniref:Uncharacterized protein n=1 Tax=Alphaentomopoxvirus acuprea TaxID=62099 RepID=W6JIL7_9POXV|nr:hypothetical protein BA82_gp058 [Anomala cuprea entomopoxvirus]BAO49418.1 hypothetical protein [Anomala cuprea entomopoxvirus]